MIFIYDNLTATIIGAMVLLIVLTSMQRLTETQIERTATYMVKKHANELSTWMEDDLLKMKEHVKSDTLRPVPYEFNDQKDNEDGLTTRFCFRQDETEYLPNGDAIQHLNLIRYRLRPAGTRHLQGGEIPVYYLQRARRNVDEDENWRARCKDDESSHWTQDGASTDLISYFRVDMLDRDAQPIPMDDYDTTDQNDRNALYELVHNTRVRFAMVTPFETDRTTLREVYYGATLILEQ